MSDNLNYKGKQDDLRININQAHEVRYWTVRFDVTKEELIEAVKKVGPMAKKVEEYFKRGCSEENK